MARIERGFKGAKLAGVVVEDDTVLNITVPADAESGIAEGTLGATVTAIGDRIKALEGADALDAAVAADAATGIEAGTLGATLTALAGRIKTLEDAAA